MPDAVSRRKSAGRVVLVAGSPAIRYWPDGTVRIRAIPRAILSLVRITERLSAGLPSVIEVWACTVQRLRSGIVVADSAVGSHECGTPIPPARRVRRLPSLCLHVLRLHVRMRGPRP